MSGDKTPAWECLLAPSQGASLCSGVLQRCENASHKTEKRERCQCSLQLRNPQHQCHRARGTTHREGGTWALLSFRWVGSTRFGLFECKFVFQQWLALFWYFVVVGGFGLFFSGVCKLCLWGAVEPSFCPSFLLLLWLSSSSAFPFVVPGNIKLEGHLLIHDRIVKRLPKHLDPRWVFLPWFTSWGKKPRQRSALWCLLSSHHQ